MGYLGWFLVRFCGFFMLFYLHYPHLTAKVLSKVLSRYYSDNGEKSDLAVDYHIIT
jgi:hypothetical protein